MATPLTAIQSNILTPLLSGEYRSPMTDLSINGQNGFMPIPMTFTSSGIYIQQPLRLFLIAAPRLFQYATNPQKEVDWLKNMIETYPIKVDGFDMTVTNEHGASTPIGNANEVLETITRSSRAASKPVLGYGADRINQSITRYWTEFSRIYLMDPDLQTPAICQNPNYIAAGSPVITPADQSFVVLAVEPDMTLTRPLKAWLSANWQVTDSIGELKGYKETAASLKSVDVDLTFTAYSQIGQAPLMFAYAILQSLNLQDLRPQELAGILNTMDANVAASPAGTLASITPDTIAPNIYTSSPAE